MKFLQKLLFVLLAEKAQATPIINSPTPAAAAQVPHNSKFNIIVNITATTALTIGTPELTYTYTPVGGSETNGTIGCSSATKFMYDSGKKAYLLFSVGGALEPGSAFKYEIAEGCGDDGALSAAKTEVALVVVDPLSGQNDEVLPSEAAGVYTRTPADDTYETGTTVSFYMFATEDVSATGKAITLTAEDGIEGTTPGDGSLTPVVAFSGAKITVTSPEAVAGKKYTVMIPAGAYKDAACNDNLASTSWSVIKPTTVKAFTPTGTNVSIEKEQRLIIEFNDPVKNGTGNITIKSGADADGTVSQTIRENWLGKFVILALTADLTASTKYTLGFPAGFFEYADEIAIAATNSAWSFTTGTALADTDEPEIVAGRIKCHSSNHGCDIDGDGIYDHFNASTDALASSADVVIVSGQAVEFQLYYNEEVTTATTPKTATLTNLTTGVIDKTVPITVDTTSTHLLKVSLGNTALEEASSYTLEIPQGAVVDMATTPNLAEGATFEFSTILATAAAANLRPTNGATNVDWNTALKIPFTAKPVPVANAKIDIVETATGGASYSYKFTETDNVAIIDKVVVLHGHEFAPAKEYKITLAAESLVGQKEKVEWTFTTRAADNLAPTVVYKAYQTATERSTIQGTKPYIIFSEGVEAVLGKKITVTDQTTTLVTDATLTSANKVESNNNKVTIGKNWGSWINGATYTFTIEAGAFVDKPSAGKMANESPLITFTISPSSTTTTSTTTAAVLTITSAALPTDVDPAAGSDAGLLVLTFTGTLSAMATADKTGLLLEDGAAAIGQATVDGQTIEITRDAAADWSADVIYKLATGVALHADWTTTGTELNDTAPKGFALTGYPATTAKTCAVSGRAVDRILVVDVAAPVTFLNPVLSIKLTDSTGTPVVVVAPVVGNVLYEISSTGVVSSKIVGNAELDLATDSWDTTKVSTAFTFEDQADGGGSTVNIVTSELNVDACAVAADALAGAPTSGSDIHYPTVVGVELACGTAIPLLPNLYNCGTDNVVFKVYFDQVLDNAALTVADFTLVAPATTQNFCSYGTYKCQIPTTLALYNQYGLACDSDCGYTPASATVTATTAAVTVDTNLVTVTFANAGVSADVAYRLSIAANSVKNKTAYDHDSDVGSTATKVEGPEAAYTSAPAVFKAATLTIDSTVPVDADTKAAPTDAVVMTFAKRLKAAINEAGIIATDTADATKTFTLAATTPATVGYDLTIAGTEIDNLSPFHQYSIAAPDKAEILGVSAISAEELASLALITITVGSPDDKSVPRIVDITPPTSGTTCFKIFFNEPVTADTGLLSDTTDVSTESVFYNEIRACPPTGSTWAAGNWTEVANKAITDSAGKTVDLDVETYAIPVSAHAAPSVAALSPSSPLANDALYINFDVIAEEVSSLGTDVLLCTADTCLAAEQVTATKTIVHYLDATDSQPKSRLVIYPAAPLDCNTSYYVKIVADAVKNVYGLGNVAATLTASVGGFDEVAPFVLGTNLGIPSKHVITTATDIVVYMSESIAYNADANDDTVLGTVDDPVGAGAGDVCTASANICKTTKGHLSPYTIPADCDQSCGTAAGASNDQNIKKTNVTISGNTLTINLGVSPVATANKVFSINIAALSFVDLAGIKLEASNNVAVVIQGGVATEPYLTCNDGNTCASNGAADITPAKWVHGDGNVGVDIREGFTFRFDSEIKLGEGTVTIGNDDIPTSSCVVDKRDNKYVTCWPEDGLLDAGTTIAVTAISAGFVETLETPGVANSAITFAAANAAAATASSVLAHSVLTADEPTSTDIVPPTHSSTTIYGSASLQPTNPVVVFTFSENIVVANTLLISVADVATAAGEVIVDGEKLIVDESSALTAGAEVKIRIPAGAVADAAGNKVRDDIEETITIRADDAGIPTLYANYPLESATEVSPTTNINLYVSEYIQEKTSGQVTVADTVTTSVIRVDGTTPDKGDVNIDGAVISINPYDDLAKEKQVTVTVPNTAFQDYYENALASKQIQFTTAGFSFTSMNGYIKDDVTDADGAVTHAVHFTPRSGATVVAINEKVLVYGGEGADGCLSDSYVSEDSGATFTKIVAGAVSPGPRFNAYVSVDKNDTIWLIGGECIGNKSTLFYKSTDNMATWTKTTAPFTASSTEDDGEKEEFPSSMEHLAFTIVGGWQPVVLDTVNGTLWAFQDAAAATVQKVKASIGIVVPRKEVALVPTNDGKLRLLGGNYCVDIRCSDNAVFTDVWEGDARGGDWVALTANYLHDIYVAADVDNSVTASRGIAKPSVAATHDGTILLIGGIKPALAIDLDNGLNKVYESFASAADTEINNDALLITYPTIPSDKLELLFDENIVIGSEMITITNTTADPNVTVVGSVSVEGPLVTVEAAWVAGTAYSVNIPAEALLDVAGNKMAQVNDADITFTLHADATGPAVNSLYPATNSTGIEPMTNIYIEFNEAIFAPEEALKVTLEATNDTREVAFEIVGQGIFIQATKPLVEGAQYTIKLPAGVVVDANRNKSASNSAKKFTVLSGSTSTATDGYANDYTEYVFAFSTTAATRRMQEVDPTAGDETTVVDSTTVVESTTASTSSTSTTPDETAPAYIEATPLTGTTDVLASTKVTVVFWFDEKVQFEGATGTVVDLKMDGVRQTRTAQIGGADTEVSVWRLDEPADLGLIKTVERIIPAEGEVKETVQYGIKLAFPADVVLVKDKAYTVQIPAVHDAAGNASAAQSTVFNTLAEAKDEIVPTIVTKYPAQDAEVKNDANTVKVYFSENVTAVASKYNNIQKNSEAVVTTSVAGNAVEGGVVTIELSSGELADGDDYVVTVDAGSYVDAAGNALAADIEGGATVAIVEVKALTKDTEFSATAVTIVPATEATPTYTHPLTRVLKITFGENIAAGAGSITLTPRFDSPTVVVPATDATIKDASAYVPTTLYPGEVYLVTFDGTAFTDISGNAAPAYTTAHQISTRAEIGFQLAGTSHFDDSDVKESGGSDAFDGQRVGAGVAVTEDNIIYVVGGKKAAGEEYMLNDIWKVDTKRAVDCAAAFMEPGLCGSTCEADSDGVITMGTSTVQKKVWKAPGVGGKECVSSDSSLVRQLDTVIASDSNACACATCLTGPEVPFDDHITDELALAVAALTAQKVTLDTTAIKCKEGWTADPDNNLFKCIFDTNYVGKWDAYPTCVPDDCKAEPAQIDFEYLPTPADCAEATFEKHCRCLEISDAKVVLHDATCEISCMPGYAKSTEPGVATCKNAAFANSPGDALLTLPTCTAKTCPVPTAPANGAACDAAVEVGGVCAATCNPGYEVDFSEDYELTCEADTALPEAEVALKPAAFAGAVCMKQDCGTKPVVVNGVVSGEDTKFEDELGVTCETNYKKIGTTDGLTCSISADGFVEWTGDVGCERVMCAAADVPVVANGALTCSGKAGESCTLACAEYYEVKTATTTECTDTSGAGAWTGVAGECVASACTFAAWPAEKEGHASHDCATVKSGEACTNITCKEDWESAGPFECGVPEVGDKKEGLCRKLVKGGDVREVKAKLDFKVSGKTDEELEVLVKDDEFKKDVKASIVEGLIRAGQKVIADDVKINSIKLVDSETTTTAATTPAAASSRRLADSTKTISVDFTVKVLLEEATAIKTFMDDSTKLKEFSEVFVEKMKEEASIDVKEVLPIKAKDPAKPKSKVGPIVGGVVGGLAAVIIIIVVVCICKKKKD